MSFSANILYRKIFMVKYNIVTAAQLTHGFKNANKKLP